MTRLARTIHKLSAAAAGSSVRTARPTRRVPSTRKRVPLDLLGVLQEYACGGLGRDALSCWRFHRFATTAYE